MDIRQTAYLTRTSTLTVFFSKNNYNEDFNQRNTHRPTTTEANDNATPTTTVTIPYIKGIFENISRILQPFNIRVAHEPITTLRQLLTNVKDKDELRNRQRAVCKINCSDWLRLTLESWFTNLEQTPLNRCQPLPAPYKRFIHDINITNEPNRTT